MKNGVISYVSNNREYVSLGDISNNFSKENKLFWRILYIGSPTFSLCVVGVLNTSRIGEVLLF